MAANTLPNLKQTVIAATVQKELEFQAKLLPTVMDVSQFVQPGSKSVSFPKLTSFTVADRDFGAAATEQTLTGTVETLNLDKNKIVSWAIDAKDQSQVSIAAEVEFAKRASAAHARGIDTAISDAIFAAGRNDWGSGVAVSDVTRDIILQMQEKLFDAEADPDQLTLVVSNKQHAELLKIAEFSENRLYGPNDAIKTGVVGSIYGMQVIRRSALAATAYYIFERSALAFAMQVGPQLQSQDDIKYGTGGKLYAMDTLYGLKAMRLNEKGAGAAESPLIMIPKTGS